MSTNGAFGGRRCGITPPGPRDPAAESPPVMVSCRRGCRNRLRSTGIGFLQECVILHRPLGGGNKKPLERRLKGFLRGPVALPDTTTGNVVGLIIHWLAYSRGAIYRLEDIHEHHKSLESGILS